MSDHPALLAIDQGTTSSRAIVFSRGGEILSQSSETFPQIYPQEGWVEHDPEVIWETVRSTARAALADAPRAVTAVGITNQRETVILWDRKTGEALHNAIVWQDRRTAAACAELRERDWEPVIRHRTGLVIDPYFSASKIAWLLDHVDGARARAERGEFRDSKTVVGLCWAQGQGLLGP